MLSEFHGAGVIIKKVIEDLSERLEKAEKRDFGGNLQENNYACGTIERLIEELESVYHKLRYYGTEAKEGNLQMDPETEKFYVAYDDGTTSNNLCCGYGIELYNKDYDDEENKWYFGRVEGRTKANTTQWENEYYFCGIEEAPALYVGMRVRKRQL